MQPCFAAAAVVVTLLLLLRGPSRAAAYPYSLSPYSSPVAPAIAVQECPGVADRICGQQCQLHICNALSGFYKVSNNVSNPWDQDTGWELTKSLPCKRLVATAPNGRATYCSWYGISCCRPDQLAAGDCSAVNIVTAVNLPINNVNVSIEDPEFLGALKVLHDCGMVVLNLESNNLIGAMTDAWDQLQHLAHLSLGANWLWGTIPESIRKMRNLTFINLSNNFLNGTLPAFIGDLTLLKAIYLGTQAGGNKGTSLMGLLGHIPKQLGQLRHLRELDLQSNSLSGTLPAGLCGAGNSSLIQLNVRYNRLEGNAQEVEECYHLIQLDISHNMLNGSLPVSSRWTELATYSASHNQFTGAFPRRLSDARLLEHIDFGHNALTGMIPNTVTLMSPLKTVILSHNKLSGTVVEDLYYMGSIAILDLSHNQFTGTTPVAIGLTYSLSELDLSNNEGLTGILPVQMGLLTKLQTVKAANTSLSCAGIVKPYNVTTNNSCTDPAVCTTPVQFGNPGAAAKRCPPNELLPCFLRFSDYTLPRDDDSNMKCKVIIRRPTAQAQQLCAGPNQLGDQAGSVAERPTDWMLQHWEVDPAYYQYQACECLLGYRAIWDDTGTVLKCVPEQRQSPMTGIIIAAVVSSAAVLAVGLAVWRQYLRTRPRWLRERTLQAKRSKGAPKAAKEGQRVRVSVVVTDVKDFSELTRRFPELMSKAMGLHNNIMRKACHAHAGYVMDQEGDSWTIAFHDPEDAVAFSLQVQQALALKAWDTRPFSEPSLRASSVARSRPSDTASDASSYDLMAPIASSRAGAAAAAAAAQGAGHGGTGSHLQADARYSRLNGSFSAASDDKGSVSRASSIGQRSHEASFTATEHRPDQPNGTSTIPARWMPNCNGFGPHAAVSVPCSPCDCNRQPCTCPQGVSRAGLAGMAFAGVQQRSFSNDTRVNMDAALLHAVPPPSQHQLGSSDCDSNKPPLRLPWNRQSGLPPTASNLSSQAAAASERTSQTCSSFATMPSSPSRIWSAGQSLVRRLTIFRRSSFTGQSLQHLAAHHHVAQEVQLSVRIGIATGYLAHGCHLNTCAPKDRAKGCVSEVANGGQILMDERTFRLIKHSLSELGAVDESGYDDRQLQQLMHAQVVAKLQRRVACGGACFKHMRTCPRQGSFSSEPAEDSPQDYDTDAMVIHMGGFLVPCLPSTDEAKAKGNYSTSEPSTPAATDSGDEHFDAADLGSTQAGPAAAPAAAAPAPAPTIRDSRGASARRSGHKAAPAAAAAAAGGRPQLMQLQLYTIAGPKMRKAPESTRELNLCTSWSLPVKLRPGWVQARKGYFEAPGARQMDLTISAHQELPHCRPPLPNVTFVFAEVTGDQVLSSKRHRSELHSLNKAIRRCMLQLMHELPGGDGYLFRCHESDLTYVVAFESAVRAAQWCLLVQEALMYIEWPDHILNLPGFEEVLHPDTGMPLFRGPRLRMGLSEGTPSSVLPDHTGHANYTGDAVNRAARFMTAASHPGQVVCDIGFARHCFGTWNSSLQPTSAGQASCDGPPGDGRSLEATPQTAATLDRLDPQAQLLALRSQSETSGHCRPATGPLGLRSRLAHDLWIQQQHERYKLQQQRQYDAVHQRLRGNGRYRTDMTATAAAGRFSSSDAGVLHGGCGLNGSHAGSLEGPSGAVVQLSAVQSSGKQQPTGSGPSFSRQYAHIQGSGLSSSRQGTGASAPSCSYQQHVHIQQQQQQAGTRAVPYNHRHMGVAASSSSFSGRGWLGAAAAAATVSEAVTASRLGSFSFKGSGEYEMVQLQHSMLLDRSFPADAPKGKGVRLRAAAGEVQGMQQVMLHIPVCLLAARAAFRSIHGASMHLESAMHDRLQHQASL